MHKETVEIKSSEDWAKILVYGLYRKYVLDIPEVIQKLKAEVEDYNSKVKVMNSSIYLLKLDCFFFFIFILHIYL
jgi:hypothetical protein